MIVAFRYADSRLLARFIAWWQRSDLSHCELALSPAVGGRDCRSSSFLDGGVRAKIIDLTPDKWRLYEVPMDFVYAEQWFDAHVGDGYDWLGLLGFLFRRITGVKKKWTCTEAVSAMLGLRDPWRFNVADLENLCALIGRRIQ